MFKKWKGSPAIYHSNTPARRVESHGTTLATERVHVSFFKIFFNFFHFLLVFCNSLAAQICMPVNDLWEAENVFQQPFLS